MDLNPDIKDKDKIQAGQVLNISKDLESKNIDLEKLSKNIITMQKLA